MKSKEKSHVIFCSKISKIKNKKLLFVDPQKFVLIFVSEEATTSVQTVHKYIMKQLA